MCDECRGHSSVSYSVIGGVGSKVGTACVASVFTRETVALAWHVALPFAVRGKVLKTFCYAGLMWHAYFLYRRFQ